HPHVVDTFAFAPNGKVLASGSRDGAVRFWDVATGKKQKTLKRDGERVLAVEFSPDGRTLATSTERAPRLSKVRLWDIRSRPVRGRPLQPGTAVEGLAFSPDGQTLALGCWDHLIHLWSPGGRQDKVRLAGHRSEGQPKEAWCVAFSPDGKTLASGGDDHA